MISTKCGNVFRDRCQNHVLGGSKVRGHYLLHDYSDEKRDAWAKLGRHLGTASELAQIANDIVGVLMTKQRK